MNNVKTHHQDTILTGLPLISIVHLENSFKIYALLHMPNGYKFKEVIHASDENGGIPSTADVVLEPGSAERTKTILVKEIPIADPSTETKVTISGGPESFEITVNHPALHIPPYDDDDTEERPFAYVQNPGTTQTAVHYSVWIPTSSTMTLSSVTSTPNKLIHTLDIGADATTPTTEMTLFRNCIWIDDNSNLTEVSIEVTRNGKNRKVMVSTDDGSVGTGG